MARRLACAIAIAVMTLAAPARACTTFALGDGAARVVGKCYDWHMGQGLVVINKRGVAKRAMTLDPKDRPAEWRSRHASVTFNQYGVEMPNGGMNDAGLVVEVMWLDSSELPPRDERPAVTELQWIQLQLDSYATAAEVAEHAGDVRIARAHGRVHYLACDARECAAVEHVGGKLVVSRGARVLTNNTYAESQTYAAAHATPPGGAGSLERFARASSMVARPTGSGVDGALRVLDSVNNADSQWHIVYEPARLRASFRSRGKRAIKWVDLGRIDASCATAAKVLDLDSDASGDVTALLQDYREQDNLRLVERSLRDVPGLPRDIAPRLAHYPSMLVCAGN
jgi:choloylglycine hydrolase